MGQACLGISILLLAILGLALILRDVMLWERSTCEYSSCVVECDKFYPYAGFLVANVTSPVKALIRVYLPSAFGYTECRAFTRFEWVLGERAFTCWVRGSKVMTMYEVISDFALWHAAGVLGILFASLVGCMIYATAPVYAYKTGK